MEINPLWGNSCTITDIVFFFLGTVVDVTSGFFHHTTDNSKAQDTTGHDRKPHGTTSHHITSDTTSLCPSAQVQTHFMPSRMRLAQEYLERCFCMKRAIRQPRNGSRPTHSGIQGKSEPCVQREPTGRVLIVIVVKGRKRDRLPETLPCVL